jgi:dephospho-CoA kinase
MLRTALTGGIATGKSYVLERFRKLGVPCLDADELTHGVMVSGTEVSRAVARRFGSNMLAADGAVDRRKLAPVVFADEQARRELEAIVHPAVYRAVASGLRAFERASDPPLAVVAIPLLYETGREGDFDRVVATVCDPATQVARLLARGLTRDEAQARLAAQAPAAEKAAHADFVITTDGSFVETDRQVEDVLRQLLALAAAHHGSSSS